MPGTLNVTVTSVVQASGLPANSSYLLDLGSGVSLGNAGSTGVYLNTGALNFADGSVTFQDQGKVGDGGVYDGSISGQASAPFLNSGNQDTANYLAAEPSGSVTISFNSTMEYFGLLWGSVDSYNSLTFSNAAGDTYTIDGTQLAALAKADANGSQTPDGSFYVEFYVPTGFDKVVATSTSAAFEFADVTYAAAQPTSGTPTPVPVTPTNPDSLCLLEGSGIATPEGRRPIETLEIGDLVILSDGSSAAIRWIGRQTVATRFADPLRNLPVRIRADALGDNLPECDLLLSPDHAVLIGGMLVQAGAMVNNVSVTREYDMPERFTYYHIELSSHALILAENVPVETFIDNVERLSFDNWAEHEALYGGAAPLVEMDLPRVKAMRQLPQDIRAALAARAGLPEGATQAA